VELDLIVFVHTRSHFYLPGMCPSLFSVLLHVLLDDDGDAFVDDAFQLGRPLWRYAFVVTLCWTGKRVCMRECVVFNVVTRELYSSFISHSSWVHILCPHDKSVLCAHPPPWSWKYGLSSTFLDWIVGLTPLRGWVLDFLHASNRAGRVPYTHRITHTHTHTHTHTRTHTRFF
jgi:hypothetical protein